MHNAVFITAVVIFIGTMLVFILLRNRLSAGKHPYQRAKRLFSPSEGALYVALVKALGRNSVVLAKVRAAEVLTPRTGLPRSEWQRALDAIASRHFDFIICDTGDALVKLAILLEDASSTDKVSARELLLKSCEAAGLPVLLLPPAKEYDRGEICRLVKEKLSEEIGECQLQEAQPQPEPEPLAAQEHEEVTSSKPEVPSPPCPRCASPMEIRTAQSGMNAGEEFWVCSRFPSCSGRIQIRK